MENFYAPKAKFNFKLPFSKFKLPSFKLKNSKVTDLPDRSVSGISKKTFKFPWKILLKSVGILLLVIVILLAIVGLSGAGKTEATLVGSNNLHVLCSNLLLGVLVPWASQGALLRAAQANP